MVIFRCLNIVTCQPIAGLRNRAFLVSCPLTASLRGRGSGVRSVSPRSARGEEQAAVTSPASPRQRNKQSRHCETPATVGEMSIVRRSATGRNTTLAAGPIGDL
jgi:hypothetical protein